MTNDDIVDQIVAMFERATPEERAVMDAHLARIYTERVVPWLRCERVDEPTRFTMGMVHMTEDEAREAGKPLTREGR